MTQVYRVRTVRIIHLRDISLPRTTPPSYPRDILRWSLAMATPQHPTVPPRFHRFPTCRNLMLSAYLARCVLIVTVTFDQIIGMKNQQKCWFFDDQIREIHGIEPTKLGFQWIGFQKNRRLCVFVEDYHFPVSLFLHLMGQETTVSATEHRLNHRNIEPADCCLDMIGFQFSWDDQLMLAVDFPLPFQKHPFPSNQGLNQNRLKNMGPSWHPQVRKPYPHDSSPNFGMGRILPIQTTKLSAPDSMICCLIGGNIIPVCSWKQTNTQTTSQLLAESQTKSDKFGFQNWSWNVESMFKIVT